MSKRRLFSRSNHLRSYRSVLNISNGWPWIPKTCTQNKQPLDKTQSSKPRQLNVEQTCFQNLKEKRKWFFDHSTTLSSFCKRHTQFKTRVQKPYPFNDHIREQLPPLGEQVLHVCAWRQIGVYFWSQNYRGYV